MSTLAMTPQTPLVYGPAVTDEHGMKTCKVFVGPHHVATVQFTGVRYFVLALYFGGKILSTPNRAEIGDLVREVAAKVSVSPRDCWGKPGECVCGQ